MKIIPFTQNEYQINLNQRDFNHLINCTSEDLYSLNKNILDLIKDLETIENSNNYEYQVIDDAINHKMQILKHDNEVLLSLLKANKSYYNPYCKLELMRLKELPINNELYNYLIKGGE